VFAYNNHAAKAAVLATMHQQPLMQTLRQTTGQISNPFDSRKV